MIVPTSNPFKLAYGKYERAHAKGLNVEAELGQLGGVEEDVQVEESNAFRDHPEQFDFRSPGKNFVEEYAKFIAHESEKLGSAGQLPFIRETLSGKITCSG